MGQEFKINDCGEIIREKLPKKRNVILRVILGIIALACIIIAFPFIVGMIRYGEGIQIILIIESWFGTMVKGGISID